ncbi:cilia- and flagella-associated protein 44-like [Elysia marginata]|uniref:Cilia- and flagella-associated protein 44-like n=1 Tax=Elysia marginata TaxID=1093978 RepID=A0AAV4F7E9_9GAST|nr:cilia- and flagella-associated protein 44-like [Elysia marginata]
MTPLERKIYNIDQIRLAYEQGKLLQDIREIVAKFDAELRLLRHDKFRMDIVMKDADLRQVTLFEELVLLKEYEIREDILAEKVANKQQEKLDMQTKVGKRFMSRFQILTKTKVQVLQNKQQYTSGNQSK